MRKGRLFFLLLVGIGLVSLLPGLSAVHLFDWDEINFAESAREMLVSGDFFTVTVNYEPFWEKPPLFFWLQAACMKLFGVNEFAARLPNALCMGLTLLVLFQIGKRERNSRFAYILSGLYFLSLLPQVYARSAIIDPLFNLFIFLSGYFVYKGLCQRSPDKRTALYGGAFAGLAILTKGPVGLLLVLLTFLVFLLVNRGKYRPGIQQIVLFALACLAFTFLWFGPELLRNGFWFLGEFIAYQIELFSQPVAGHSQPFYYHFVVVFLGTFPLSILSLPKLLFRDRIKPLDQWMMCLFWVVLILFSIVETKIVHYSSMTYLPLAWLAASAVYRRGRWKSVPIYSKVSYGFIGALLAFAIIGIPLAGYYRESLTGLFNDPFAVAGLMNPAIKWSLFDVLPSLGVLAAIIVLPFYWRRMELKKGILVSAILLSVSLTACMMVWLPKIEASTQGPLIAFLEEKQGEQVYLAPAGMKSYAHYFYFRQPQDPNPAKAYRAASGSEAKGQEFQRELSRWLIYGEIDRAVYFFCKVTHNGLDDKPGIELLSQEGGYKFYRRNP